MKSDFREGDQMIKAVFWKNSWSATGDVEDENEVAPDENFGCVQDLCRKCFL